MAKSKQSAPEAIEIKPIKMGQVQFWIVGESPLVLNRLPEKARQELLLPKPRGVSRSTLKHDPIAEFRSSMCLRPRDHKGTRICVPSTALKNSIRTAALDLDGASKAQVGRLCYIPGEKVDVYGTPEVYMAVVRQSGIGRTPDVRTRAIIKEWACGFSVDYVKPMLSDTVLGNLVNAAGVFCGIGDGRPEKGALSFGRFSLVPETDAKLRRIVKMGAAEQDEAIADPAFYDQDSEDLYSWFHGAAGER